MIKRPFFGFGKPRLEYTGLDGRADLKEIPIAGKATLPIGLSLREHGESIIQVGDTVKTGQTLRPFAEVDAFLTSTATGTITAISQDTGYLGRKHTFFAIDVEARDQWDTELAKIGTTPSPSEARKALASLPGCPDFASLIHREPPLHTIIINGIDKDLLVATNQFVVRERADALLEGIECLKNMTGEVRVILVVLPGNSFDPGDSNVEMMIMEPVYPNALPSLIMKNLFGKALPPGKNSEDIGVGFINAEAIVALKEALAEGQAPIHKIVTVIDKSERTVLVRTRIGTPISDILSTLNIQTEVGDRIIFGGPMRGHTVYSEEMPVLQDTDAIMIQDGTSISPNPDIPCVNCGECVRACPVNIPVNMLIRLMENGLYQEAAEEYDLLSCIECGLCSYVCLERIPISHYIALAKYEIALATTAGESNA